MSIPIPYGMDYTSTMAGLVVKLVHCESCQAEYVYQLERTARGSGTSFLFLDNEGASARASAQAEQELRQKLEQGVDLVPCPVCGWYQRHMIPKAKRQYRRWMLNVGACLTLGLIPLAFIGAFVNASSGNGDGPAIPWPAFGAGLLILFLLGAGLMIAKAILASRYDPNSVDVETRKKRGQWCAMLRSDFERMLKAESERKASPGNTAGADKDI